MHSVHSVGVAAQTHCGFHLLEFQQGIERLEFAS